jgi:hypothetical protein
LPAAEHLGPGCCTPCVRSNRRQRVAALSGALTVCVVCAAMLVWRCCPHGLTRQSIRFYPHTDKGAFERATLWTDANAALARSSRLRPGFGTTSPQRQLPARFGLGVPGPDAYQPFEPRQRPRVLRQFAHLRSSTSADGKETPRDGRTPRSARTPRTPRTPRTARSYAAPRAVELTRQRGGFRASTSEHASRLASRSDDEMREVETSGAGRQKADTARARMVRGEEHRSAMRVEDYESDEPSGGLRADA